MSNMYFDIKQDYVKYLLSLIDQKEFVDYISSIQLDSLKLLDEMIINLETVIEKTYPDKKINKLKRCIISDIRRVDDKNYTVDQDGKIFGKMSDSGRVIQLSESDVLKLKEMPLHSFYL